MPRTARIKQENAIYHIMSRGNNREPIFFNDDDKSKYLCIIKKYKEKYQMKVHAYCLMDNHIHLIISSNGQDISKIMQGINLSYTIYVNKSYNRCGHLFQDRFRSEIIDTEEYLLTASAYIHQNPIRADIVKNVYDYKWSSIGIYLGQKDAYKLLDEELILKYFSKDKSEARAKYLDYVQKECKMKISEVEKEKYTSSDQKFELKECDIDSVLKKVSTCFDVCLNELTIKNNKRIAVVRQIAVYIAYLKSKKTYGELGKKFGVCGSAIGKNINKAIEILSNSIEKRKYFEFILQG